MALSMVKSILAVKHGSELRGLLLKVNTLSVGELANLLGLEKVSQRFCEWLIKAGGNGGLVLTVLTKLAPTMVFNFGQFYEPLEATARSETIFERRMLAIIIMQHWFPGCEIPVPWPMYVSCV